MILQKFGWCNTGVYNIPEISKGRNNLHQWQCYIETVRNVNYYIFIIVYMMGWETVTHGVHVECEGRVYGIGSVLPPCEGSRVELGLSGLCVKCL